MQKQQIQVPAAWTPLYALAGKLQDGVTYYIKNASQFKLYYVESDTLPEFTADSPEVNVLLSNKCAGYIKTDKTLYVAHLLPNKYPLPQEIGVTVCIEMPDTPVVGIGSFKPSGTKCAADLETVEASVSSVLARMDVLEQRISDINKTNVEAVVLEGTVPVMKDETKDYVIKGELKSAATITGKSITMKDAKITNLGKVVGTAQGDVDIKAMSIEGQYPVSPANVILDFAADGYVTIKNTEFNVGTYNAINIGLRQPAPKGVLIDNVKFFGKCRNNAISVYSTQENAVININNCYFENVSNAIRVCNSLNTSCTVNVTNCRCDKWEENLKYTGMFLCEDIVSKTAEEANANNFFGKGKVVINISNFTLPNGEKLVAQDLAKICGTQDENQIFYVHDVANKVRAYSTEFYPVINIL